MQVFFENISENGKYGKFIDKYLYLWYNIFVFFQKEATQMKKDKNKNKKKKWLKFRHRIVRNLLFATLGVYVRLRYRVKIERFKEQEKHPYLVLMKFQPTEISAAV